MRSIRECSPPVFTTTTFSPTPWSPPTSELGLERPSSLYRARLGATSAVVFEAVAPGRLLGADTSPGRGAGGWQTGRRAGDPGKETPGLGDYIDPRKDKKNRERPWITQFNGLSFVSLPEGNGG